ncbi:MAG: nucleotide sugar dehydrogenase [Methanomassiliicoccales archaeon]
MSKPTICVIGLGYIGLPTSIIFANNGFTINGCDISQKIVNAVNNKAPLITEPGLLEKLSQAVDSGKLIAHNNPTPSDIYIIAVPTPVNHETKGTDLSYVVSATKSILPLLKKGDMVVLESTVPPGTTRDIVGGLITSHGLKLGQDVDLAHAPEKAIPGKLFFELENNDRVLGGYDHRSTERVYELYKHMTKGQLIKTDCTTAEMVKLMENTYRDVNIALANEFAMLSERLGVNVWEAIEYANHHPRVKIHQPGPGVGGHCIAVDPWFLVNTAPDIMKMVSLARKTNDGMPSFTVDKVRKVLSEQGIVQPKIAVLGLAFKANVDDVRESPSVTVCEILSREGIQYTAFDPLVKGDLVKGQTQSLEEAVRDSDMILFLVNHDRFKTCDPQKLGGIMRNKIVLDTKNGIDLDAFKKAGFATYLLGSG